MKRMIAAALAAMLGAGTASAAAKPVGIVLDVQGAVTPAPLPFTEVEAGLLLTLAPGAAITIALYDGCNQYAVKGAGQARVEAGDVDVIGSLKEKMDVGCAERVALEAGSSAQAGGMVLRRAPSYVAARFDVVFVGDGSVPASDARITRETGGTVVTLPIVNGRAQWGTNPPLSDGKYVLTIAGADPIPLEVGAGNEASLLAIPTS